MIELKRTLNLTSKAVVDVSSYAEQVKKYSQAAN
jgi:hypothetical protein